MALTVIRTRQNDKPGHRVVRGLFTWTTTSTTGTLTGLPVGNVIGARFTDVGPSVTPTSTGIDATPTNGVIACSGSLAIVRASGGLSGGSCFYEIEYDSQ